MEVCLGGFRMLATVNFELELLISWKHHISFEVKIVKGKDHILIEILSSLG